MYTYVAISCILKGYCYVCMLLEGVFTYLLFVLQTSNSFSNLALYVYVLMLFGL